MNKETEEAYRKIASKVAMQSDHAKKNFYFKETWLVYVGLIETWDIVG